MIDGAKGEMVQEAKVGALWSWKQGMVQDRKREDPTEEGVQSHCSRMLKPS